VSPAGDDRLRRWAETLYARHGEAIGELVGVPSLPVVRIEVADGGAWAAWTTGRTVTLNAGWFGEHADDVGGCLHEFAHAVMHAPARDGDSWLIEGIADYVRDALGFAASWTFAHFEPGGATAGYQTTAHFLLWLEGRSPGVVRELARRLTQGRYDDGAFDQITGASLPELVEAYESEQPANDRDRR
jgi:hypothetical protein